MKFCPKCQKKNFPAAHMCKCGHTFINKIKKSTPITPITRNILEEESSEEEHSEDSGPKSSKMDSISNEPGHQKNKENQMKYLHDNDEEERDPDYEEEKKKNNPINFQHFAQNHVPQVIKRTKTSERRGRCEWRKLSRIGKNRGNKDIRVNTMCSGCNVYLHFEGCWEFFHRDKIA